ncbi:Aste57867_11953 [Aphanomyces stellatus]|uniref:Aste57867_11953 protein n=1 Tax=Aphanomyces stellatus TaxID=120398 RepID=A0A485KUQ6_9STRA|nr:hypothetical protein As57867_011908 [Aphanomyces stellatus]VFT88808.1 Aste57867_11953 [Aphanomyces stellatus]
MARQRVTAPKEAPPALTKVDEPEPVKEPSPSGKTPNPVGKSPLWHFSISFVGLALVACGYALGYLAQQEQQTVQPFAPPILPHPYDATSIPGRQLTLKNGTELDANGNLVPKYETDIVHVDGQHFLEPAECTAAVPAIQGVLTHVKDAMAIRTSLQETNRAFFLLNGRNDGLYVTWTGDADCLHAAAKTAAIALGADRDRLEYGLRLVDQFGLSITSASDFEAHLRIAHVLLEFQIWVWPGIEIGHEYNIDGVVLKTVGLSPIVFAVSNFFTAGEAQTIIDVAREKLERSKVTEANTSKAVSKSRTSHTAFLTPSTFTRDFQRRSATLARLPSPSFAEGLQLVRYEAGEFYRRHLDTFDGKELLPKGYYDRTLADYKAWATWAAAQLDAMDPAAIPDGFRKGQWLYPVPDDDTVFPLALVKEFLAVAGPENFFVARYDAEWVKWMEGYVANHTPNITSGLFKEKGKPHYLDKMVRIWEAKLGLPSVRYTFPKTKRINGVSHYFQWVRWAKERISTLSVDAPDAAQPWQPTYPKYSTTFQTVLVNVLLDDLSSDYLTHQMNLEWYNWMVTNRHATGTLLKILAVFPTFAEVAIRAWESRVLAGASLRYKMPAVVKHHEPNRFVTLFMYLNDVDEGGETVFPFSTDRLVTEIERTGMEECSEGLAVPPTKLMASLFYVQTPDQEIDQMARHGGCPPMQGVKWGSNSFMWNADAEEGANFWTR